MNNDYDAIIVGAGHNGLVTAGYLAKAGLRVLVLERRAVIGGVAVTEEIYPGFKVDSCVHGVGWLHPKVMRDLKLAQYGLEIVRNDLSVFAPLPDGDSLLLWQDAEKSKEGIRKFSHSDAERWDAFSKLVAQVGALLEAAYSSAPPDIIATNPGDLFSLIKIAGRLRRMGRRDMAEIMRALPMPVTDLLDDWFETDVLKGTLAASGITGIFQGPKAPGTAFVMFHHHVGSKGLLRSRGLVRGGVGTLADALSAAAKQHGAEIRTGSEIEQIIVADGQATGIVLTSGEKFSAKLIVSNANPRSTFLDLVGTLQLDQNFVRKVRNIKFKGAVAKVNLALNELPMFSSMPDNGSHLRGTISISPNMDYLEHAYDDAKYGDASQQPYLEAVIPSLSDSTLAPDGKHVMSILVQYVPYHLKEGVWDDARREALFDSVIETLAEYAPNVKGAIEHSQVLTPLDLEEIYDLPEGNLYHGDLTLDQVFLMRPVPGWAQYRTPIKNLYLCGAGTHPGGGLAGAPGYNAAREVMRAAKR